LCKHLTASKFSQLTIKTSSEYFFLTLGEFLSSASHKNFNKQNETKHAAPSPHSTSSSYNNLELLIFLLRNPPLIALHINLDFEPYRHRTGCWSNMRKCGYLQGEPSVGDMAKSPSSQYGLKAQEEYVLEQPYPDDLPDNATAADRRAYEKHCNDSLDVSCLMLATMSPDLQKQYEHADAHIMIEGLHGMFQNQARTGGSISQSPCLRASCQKVARSVLM
jgi:hypothetical protein